ncbi:MAG: DNA recombination protein RmuC [Desulfobacterales bacterium]|uniref:DNA recombination protein RmuC n=1 Tax=Candidatus Desulfatibia vada TaxID=2841696 RepID=A0A8J6NTX4_9BACT|nr:DNA recombination protein RmuC [Candidatus Desulfatibia vada]MBL6972689.1 DNA recombination protein RmuC [Desulfobacterales bacterium]
MIPDILLLLAIVSGFLAGLLIGLAVWHRTRSAYQSEREEFKVRIATLEKGREADMEQLKWTEQAESKMREAFTALASEALKDNSEALSRQARSNLKSLVDPLKENLTSLDGYVRELERARKGAYESLKQQLSQLDATHARLQKTTTTLSQALKSPTVRGRWGELQLRRVVEMAGMVSHVSFDEQTSTESGRPDMIVYLPNGGILPIDSKVPLKSYLTAMEETDDQLRKAHLAKHAKDMRERVKELARKQYWDQFDETPDFVVMFIPNEACLGTAFENDPDLLEYAIDKKVLISSPVNLIALLRAVAYGWQQHQITKNALKIAREGQELYNRLERFIDRLTDVGKYLKRSVEGYNRALGSLDNRLIPAVRRFQEMGLSTTQLDAPPKIEVQPILPPASEIESLNDDD